MVFCVTVSNSKNSIFSRSWFRYLAIIMILIAVIPIATVYIVYRNIEPDLPDITGLIDIQLQIPLRIYSQNGKLIAQYGEKKRIPVAFSETPEQLTQAFLAAEDDRFFSHPGVDYKGLLRAGIQLLLTGKKRQGGSTITMQVARNFFLSRDKTFTRKIKEIFLALKIQQQLSKQDIFELYLNKIYLGHRAYGIGAAAEVYYGKKIWDLSLAQWAMIAGLPKAPSRFNPLTNPTRAIERRDYVLRRMQTLDFISQTKFKDAVKQPVTAKTHTYSVQLSAAYVAEMVRNKMVKDFGEDAYTGGYKVFTTLDERLQISARKALHRALHDYNERHGYKGPEGNISPLDIQNFSQIDLKLKEFPKIGDTRSAVVQAMEDKSISAYIGNRQSIQIPWEGLKWTRKYRSENRRGRSPKKASDIVSIGDIIRVRLDHENQWVIAQVPSVSGALVSLNPADGGIVALAGGFDFYHSKYNRAIQAKRQPGSGFKPVIYTKALEEGFTAASIIDDAPLVYVDPWTSKVWRPKNYSGKFHGPTRLRVALRKSRNLVSIRLLREIGIDQAVISARRFGFPENQIPRTLSMALGSGSATPLQMARVYSVFANGGFLIDPYFISRVETENGDIVREAIPKTACPNCGEMGEQNEIFAPRVMSPQINYLMLSLLKDVVQRGTAVKAKRLGRSDIAGKTGTTNDQRDAWFNGFSPTMTSVAWVGFDSSKPLGNRETGGKAALPMWIYYTEEALKFTEVEEVEKPEGIVTVNVNKFSGLLASPENPGSIAEVFRQEYAPGSGIPSRGIYPYASDDSENSEIQDLF